MSKILTGVAFFVLVLMIYGLFTVNGTAVLLGALGLTLCDLAYNARKEKK